MVLLPDVVSVPPPTLDVLLTTVKPAGSTSVRLTPVSAEDVFELVMVNVRLVVPFSGIVGAPKAALTLGATRAREAAAPSISHTLRPSVPAISTSSGALYLRSNTRTSGSKVPNLLQEVKPLVADAM